MKDARNFFNVPSRPDDIYIETFGDLRRYLQNTYITTVSGLKIPNRGKN